MFHQSKWLQGSGSYVSPGILEKGEGMGSKTFRQIFQEWNSLSPSEGFGMSFSCHTVKYGRWFDTEAKAVNTVEHEAARVEQSVLPTAVASEILLVLHAPLHLNLRSNLLAKPHSWQTLQEDLSPASQSCTKSLMERAKGDLSGER